MRATSIGTQGAHIFSSTGSASPPTLMEAPLPPRLSLRLLAIPRIRTAVSQRNLTTPSLRNRMLLSSRTPLSPRSRTPPRSRTSPSRPPLLLPLSLLLHLLLLPLFPLAQPAVAVLPVMTRTPPRLSSSTWTPPTPASLAARVSAQPTPLARLSPSAPRLACSTPMSPPTTSPTRLIRRTTSTTSPASRHRRFSWWYEKAQFTYTASLLCVLYISSLKSEAKVFTSTILSVL